MIFLDGGLGHELKGKTPIPKSSSPSKTTTTFLDGALANLENPSVIVDIHREYIRRAECNVITSSNFVVTPHHLAKAGLSDDDDLLERLTRASVSNAAEARRLEGAGGVRIAGCLPPLGEAYRDAAMSTPNAISSYSILASCLIDAGADLLLAETLTSTAEALACVAASPPRFPLWVSFSLRDDLGATLRGGDDLASAASAAIALAARSDRKLEAILVNCSAPASCEAGLRALADLPGADDLGLGAYANGFRETTSQWLAPSTDAALVENPSGDYDRDGLITPEAYGRWAARWAGVSPRVRIIGGCCGVGVAHMTEARRAVLGQ